MKNKGFFFSRVHQLLRWGDSNLSPLGYMPITVELYSLWHKKVEIQTYFPKTYIYIYIDTLLHLGYI